MMPAMYSCGVTSTPGFTRERGRRELRRAEVRDLARIALLDRDVVAIGRVRDRSSTAGAAT
jgi:hypothetical protein